MLKFSDLNRKYENLQNFLNSYLKLFPNSYTPLLVMYLAHEGLLKLVDEFDVNDPRIIACVDGDTLADFVGNSCKDMYPEFYAIAEKIKGPNPSDEEVKIAFSLHNELFIRKRIIDIYDLGITLFELSAHSTNHKPVALIADSSDETILDIIKIITHNDRSSENPATLLLYSVMLKDKFEEYESSDDDSSESSYEKNLRKSQWIKDFEDALATILSYGSDSFECQPNEITRVILSQTNGGSIYNPFAGLASYSVQNLVGLGDNYYSSSASVGDYYYGEEINEIAWAVGKIRLLAYHADSKNYDLGDSTNWRGGVADNVLCTPPFNLRIENEDGEQEYADSFVIRRGLNMIDDNGLIACVVPLNFLYRKDTEQIRKCIVDNRWLETIVYLPDRLYYHTNIRTVILFIRKTEHKNVLFINATKATKGIRGRQDVLDEEIVANVLYHKTYPQSYKFEYDYGMRMEEDLPESLFYSMKTYADFETIAKSNYDLSLGRYYIDSLSAPRGSKYVPLKDFIAGLPESVGTEGTGKVVGPSLLSNDAFTTLSSSGVSEAKYKKHFKVIDRDAILFSLTSSIRPTLLKCVEGDKVYFDPTKIGAVYLSEHNILPEYVIVELVKPYILEQLEFLYKGHSLPRLYLDDFLLVRIQIPDSHIQTLSKEKEVYDSAKDIYLSEINEELAALKDKEHLDYIKNLRQRKHRILQIMNEFAPAFSLLNRLRGANGGILRDNDIVATRTGETVANYFEKLQGIVDKIEELITNLVDNERFEKSSIVDMVEYIHSIPQKHISSKYDFEIVDRREPDAFENDEPVPMENPLVEIGINELSTVFDNIIANAAKWGFTEDNRNDYRIKIELFDDILNGAETVRICISNNGTPIHESVDRKRFFEWGYGSGSGIGTWQLRNIIEHYGGQIILNEYPDDKTGFQTEYEIVLPIVNVD